MLFIGKMLEYYQNKKDAFYKQRAFLEARKDLLQTGGLSLGEKALLRTVSLNIHPDDDMYVRGFEKHYLSVGLSAVRCINTILERSGRTGPVSSVLDFPCGFGRVLRFLKQRFADAKITAVEIDPEFLRFCKTEFSVDTFPSKIDLSKVALPGKYDLIWCGSLVTHLDKENIKDLLQFFYGKLSKQGICVFTTHGQLSISLIKEKKAKYGLTPVAEKSLLTQFGKNGFGYADYDQQDGYGVSIISHDQMTKLAKSVGDWKEVSFIEHGWDNHQDVYGFMKS